MNPIKIPSEIEREHQESIAKCMTMTPKEQEHEYNEVLVEMEEHRKNSDGFFGNTVMREANAEAQEEHDACITEFLERGVITDDHDEERDATLERQITEVKEFFDDDPLVIESRCEYDDALSIKFSN